MEKRQYEITVSGCDDSTSIVQSLTESEFILVNGIATQITAASNYACMPRMSVTPFTSESKS